MVASNFPLATFSITTALAGCIPQIVPKRPAMVQGPPCCQHCMNTQQEDNPCPACLYSLAISTRPGSPRAQATGKAAAMWKGWATPLPAALAHMGQLGVGSWLPAPDPRALHIRQKDNNKCRQEMQLTACHSAPNCWCFPLGTFP